MEFSQKFCLHDICKVLIHWPAWCCGWSIGPCRRNRLCFGACFGHFGLCACSQLMVVFLATLWVRQGLKCLIDQMKGFLESASQTAKKETYGLQSCSVLWVYDLSAVQCCTSISLKSSLRRKKNLCKIEKIGHLQNQVSTLTCSNLTAFWLHCAVTLSLTQNTHASWLSVPCWLQTPYFWFYPSCFMVVSCKWNLRHFIIFQDCPCFLLCLDALAGHASWSLTWFHPGWRCAAAARYRREIS